MLRVYLIVAVLVTIIRNGNSASCHVQCRCESTKYMDCPSMKLTSLPEGYWPNVEEMHIPDNVITTLYPYSFTGYPNMKTLDLENNRLSVLDFELFSTMPRLRSLYLIGNNIGSILAPSSDIILNDLDILALDGNNIKYLDPDLLAKVAPKLDILDLNENPIQISEKMPLLNHPKLHSLELSDTDGKNVGVETFAGAPRLTWIHLKRMGLVDVTGLFVNHNVVNVDLEGNEITQLLPGTFKASRTMQKLSLRKNPLQKLDLASINEVMYGDKYSEVDISDTPLACNCQYDSIYWWGQGRGITVIAGCNGGNNCLFKKSPSNNTSSY